MKSYIILATLICVGVTSCRNYNQIKNEELRDAFILNSSSTFEGYYYVGSDNNFHYFESRWQFQKDRLFKIPLNKLKIEDNYKINFNSKTLRIVKTE